MHAVKGMEDYETWENSMRDTEARLTKSEAVAIDLVHHGLQGKSVEEAAKIMGVDDNTVYRLLEGAEAKAPNLFPILTVVQAKTLHYYTVEGFSVAQIAITRDVSRRSIRSTLSKLRAKGVLNDDRPTRPLSFDEQTMSSKVVCKW